MRLVSESLDDLQFNVLKRLLNRPTSIINTSRGEVRETTAALLVLKNPRARLGRSIRQGRLFSSLGELTWYLAGSNELDFISYYIPKYIDESSDGKTVRGAYGERLFKSRQVYRVIALLRRKRNSRRAVVQIFQQRDLRNDIEVPCTISLQLLVRNNKLDLIASMRSNDAFLGLPHDVFAFTMIQEIIARQLSIDVGTYTHFVGSLHLYSEHIDKAKEYVADGFQRRIEMPAMPVGDPLKSVKRLVSAEKEIRESGRFTGSTEGLNSYWIDLITLLRAFRYMKDKNSKGVFRMRHRLSETFYHQYIDMKSRRKEVAAPPSQSELQLK